MTRDARVIASARGEAEAVIARDPGLEHHPDLAAAITERLDEESQAYLQRA